MQLLHACRTEARRVRQARAMSSFVRRGNASRVARRLCLQPALWTSVARRGALVPRWDELKKLEIELASHQIR